MEKPFIHIELNKETGHYDAKVHGMPVKAFKDILIDLLKKAENDEIPFIVKGEDDLIDLF